MNLISRKSATNFSELPKEDYKSVKIYFAEGPNDVGIYKVSNDNYKEIKSELFFYGENNSTAFNHISYKVYDENNSTFWISDNNGLGLNKFNHYSKKFKLYVLMRASIFLIKTSKKPPLILISFHLYIGLQRYLK